MGQNLEQSCVVLLRNRHGLQWGKWTLAKDKAMFLNQAIKKWEIYTRSDPEVLRF